MTQMMKRWAVLLCAAVGLSSMLGGASGRGDRVQGGVNTVGTAASGF